VQLTENSKKVNLEVRNNVFPTISSLYGCVQLHFTLVLH
jgi:hypothetical protein